MRVFFFRFPELDLIHLCFRQGPAASVQWDTSMKRQYLDTLLPFDRVDANHRGLAGKIDCCNDRIELGHIEIPLELFARFPLFNDQQRLAPVEFRIETRIEASRRNPCRPEHRTKSAQQCQSPVIGSHDMHREDNQDSCLSVAAPRIPLFLAFHRKKRANPERAARSTKTFAGLGG